MTRNRRQWKKIVSDVKVYNEVQRFRRAELGVRFKQITLQSVFKQFNSDFTFLNSQYIYIRCLYEANNTILLVCSKA